MSEVSVGLPFDPARVRNGRVRSSIPSDLPLNTPPTGLPVGWRITAEPEAALPPALLGSNERRP